MYARNFSLRLFIILTFFLPLFFSFPKSVYSSSSYAQDCTNLDYVQRSFQFSNIKSFSNPGNFTTDLDQYGYRWTEYQSLGIRYDIPFPGDIVIMQPYAKFYFLGGAGELYPRNTDATFGHIGKIDSASPLEINGKKYFQVVMRTAGWIHNIIGGPFLEAGCPNIITSSILVEQNSRSISYWGKTFEITATSGKSVVDISNESSKVGSWVSLQTITGGESQKWLVEPAGDGFFRIRSQKNGACLGIPEDSKKDNEEIILMVCKSGDNQKWKFTFDEESPLQLRQSKKVLDISGGIVKNGIPLVQRSPSDVKSQDWSLSWHPFPKCHLKGKTICSP